MLGAYLDILTQKGVWGQGTNGNYQITPKVLIIIDSTANSVRSKVVENMISDNFCLKKYHRKTPNRGRETKN